MTNKAAIAALTCFVFTASEAADARHIGIENDLQMQLISLRSHTVVELVDSNMKGHLWFMRANSILNTLAHTCAATAVFASSAAGFWKRPEVAFAASGIGLAAITFRGLADYAKKQAKEKLSNASSLLRDEGVRSLDSYMRSDSNVTDAVAPSTNHTHPSAGHTPAGHRSLTSHPDEAPPMLTVPEVVTELFPKDKAS